MREFNLSIIKIQSKEIGTQIDWALLFDRKEVKPLCRELKEDRSGLVSTAMLSQFFGKTRNFIRF